MTATTDLTDPAATTVAQRLVLDGLRHGDSIAAGTAPTMDPTEPGQVLVALETGEVLTIAPDGVVADAAA